jgi:hypothetical protein
MAGPVWELRITRLGLQRRADQVPSVRTYGAYQVFIDNQPVANLAGHICERTGPGDNSQNGKDNHLRIAQGRYRLRTQFGPRYRTVGFTPDEHHPLPGFGFMEDDTGTRSDILVHPGHHPNLYVSSIGCLNPTRPLAEHDLIDFNESRPRVIALIDSLKLHDPGAFAPAKIGHKTPIKNAFAVVVGEPMGPVPAGPAV